MPRRFFVSKEDIQQERIRFSKEESHHIVRVLRMQPGDSLEVFDGHGDEYVCRILNVTPVVEVVILEKINSQTESPIKISLAQSLIKSDKFDVVVQKTTELGIFQIFPVTTERTEIRIPEEKAWRRVERWQKIAQEAAKQSRRSVVPVVHDIEPLERLLARYQGAPWLLTEQRGAGFKSLLAQPNLSDILLVVGPEGGWSDNDLTQAAAHGGIYVSLGRRILRTETAGLAALAIIQYQLGDLG